MAGRTSPARSRSHAALVAAAITVGLSLLPASSDLRVAPFDTYGKAVVAGSVPYRDFSIEYPPGALLPIIAPALPTTHYELWFRLLEALIGAAIVLVVADVVRGRSRRDFALAVGSVALLPALLGPLVSFRYDLFPSLLVAIGLTVARRGRPRLAGGAIGIAIAAKAYAVGVLPALLLASGRGKATRALTWSIAAAAACVLPFAAIAPGGVYSSVTRQVGRGLQIETTAASIIELFSLIGLGTPSAAFAGGSWTLVGSGASAAGTATSVLGVLAIVGLWLLVWRRRVIEVDAALVAAATVALLLVFGKVFSPQYLVWLVPLLAMASAATGNVTLILAAGAAVLTQIVYPYLYERLVAIDSLPVALLVTRNILVVAIAAILVRTVIRESSRREVRAEARP